MVYPVSSGSELHPNPNQPEVMATINKLMKPCKVQTPRRGQFLFIQSEKRPLFHRPQKSKSRLSTGTHFPSVEQGGRTVGPFFLAA